MMHRNEEKTVKDLLVDMLVEGWEIVFNIHGSRCLKKNECLTPFKLSEASFKELMKAQFEYGVFMGMKQEEQIQKAATKAVDAGMLDNSGATLISPATTITN